MSKHFGVWRRVTLALVVASALVSACQRAESGGATPGATAGASASSRPGWPAVLTIGVATDNDGDAPIEENRLLGQRIEAAAGVPVRFFTATSYTAIVEALRAKRIDAMQLGVFSYLLAAQQADAEAMAVYINTFAEPAVRDPGLEHGYYSIIFAKKGNGVASLADLKGRTFNFGDPASTSGHLVPKTELLRAGLVADRDFKTRFTGDHAAALVSLWNGRADAAAASERNLHNIVESGLIEYCGFPTDAIRRGRSPAEVKAMFDSCPDGKVVPIHYSFPIPGTPFAVRRDLPADFKAAIKTALLSTAEDPRFIRAAKRWYVDPSVERGLTSLDAYYDPLRKMAKLLDLDLSKMD